MLGFMDVVLAVYALLPMFALLPLFAWLPMFACLQHQLRHFVAKKSKIQQCLQILRMYCRIGFY